MILFENFKLKKLNLLAAMKKEIGFKYHRTVLAILKRSDYFSHVLKWNLMYRNKLLQCISLFLT